VEPAAGRFDREFDSNGGRPARRGDEPLENHQRIVVNPFLTILAWVVMLGLVRASIRTQSLALFLAGGALLLLACLLLQFHCLDCGKTDWLLRRRVHACEAVVIRWRNQDTRRFRGPSVRAQLIAWFLFVTITLVLGTVALLSRR
jgi:hypothetical protein